MIPYLYYALSLIHYAYSHVTMCSMLVFLYVLMISRFIDFKFLALIKFSFLWIISSKVLWICDDFYLLMLCVTSRNLELLTMEGRLEWVKRLRNYRSGSGHNGGNMDIWAGYVRNGPK